MDFETVTDLFDDFSHIPKRVGQPLIFMIGFGYIQDGQWKFTCFTADRLDEPSEAKIIDAWARHMDSVRRQLAPDVETPLVFHWSHAEKTNLDTAYNAAKVRHPDKDLPTLGWFDLLKEVMRKEPVVVRGALGFGLKSIAKALHEHGLIATIWRPMPASRPNSKRFGIS